MHKFEAKIQFNKRTKGNEWKTRELVGRVKLVRIDHQFFTCTNPIIHTPLLPTKVLHNHCLQFLLGHKDVPREIYAIVLGRRGFLRTQRAKNTVTDLLVVPKSLST